MVYIDTFLTWFSITLLLYGVGFFLTKPILNGIMCKVSSGKELGIANASDLSNQKTNKTMDLDITFPDPATQKESYLSTQLYVAGSFPQDNKDLTIDYSTAGQRIYRSSTHT